VLCPYLGADNIHAQLNSYIFECSGGRARLSDASPFKFWQEKQAVFDKLAPIAQDLLAAPASQAYVERIFSASGLLSSGKMNRMDKSLEMRTWMKVNAGQLKDSDFV